MDDARKKLWVRSIACAMARRYAWDSEDLFGIAWSAFLWSEIKYDPARGVAFRSYASWFIRVRLKDYIKAMWPAPHRKRDFWKQRLGIRAPLEDYALPPYSDAGRTEARIDIEKLRSMKRWSDRRRAGVKSEWYLFRDAS